MLLFATIIATVSLAACERRALGQINTKARANENWALSEHQNYDLKNVHITAATLIKCAQKTVY
jgi:hypothetical protein